MIRTSCAVIPGIHNHFVCYNVSYFNRHLLSISCDTREYYTETTKTNCLKATLYVFIYFTLHTIPLRILFEQKIYKNPH